MRSRERKKDNEREGYFKTFATGLFESQRGSSVSLFRVIHPDELEFFGTPEFHSRKKYHEKKRNTLNDREINVPLFRTMYNILNFLDN